MEKPYTSPIAQYPPLRYHPGIPSLYITIGKYMAQGIQQSDTFIKSVAGHICRAFLVITAILYTADSLVPADLSLITGILGLLIFFSALPLVKATFARPAFIFISLSLLTLFHYHVEWMAIIDGINSMLGIFSIVTVLQLFIIPIRAGGYDRALETYLKGRFTTESRLYMFISLIGHILGSFMLFGTVPMLYALFGRPLKDMVHQPERFAVTAIGRGFSLVTLWAPGAVSVMLVTSSTGASWVSILPGVVVLAIMGMFTSFLIENIYIFKGAKLPDSQPVNSIEASRDRWKIVTLFVIAGILMSGILLLDLNKLFTGSVRVIVTGTVTLSIWTLFHRKSGTIGKHLGEYWNVSLGVQPDLSVLFLAMGIFTAVIQASPVMLIIQSGIIKGTTVIGPLSFLLIAPGIVLLSLTGIHPLIGVGFTGTILAAALPDQTTIIALALLLGTAVSYSFSPFAGNLITLARFAGCSPAKAAFSWNGVFSLIFLLEGFLVISAAAFLF